MISSDDIEAFKPAVEDYTFSVASVTPPIPPNTIEFRTANSVQGVSINFDTGQITIPKHMTVEDAARAFWDGVESLASAYGLDMKVKKG